MSAVMGTCHPAEVIVAPASSSSVRRRRRVLTLTPATSAASFIVNTALEPPDTPPWLGATLLGVSPWVVMTPILTPLRGVPRYPRMKPPDRGGVVS